MATEAAVGTVNWKRRRGDLGDLEFKSRTCPHTHVRRRPGATPTMEVLRQIQGSIGEDVRLNLRFSCDYCSAAPEVRMDKLRIAVVQALAEGRAEILLPLEPVP